MRARRVLPRLAALGGALAGVAAVFFGAVRPWYRRWGATDQERRRHLPGNDIVPDAADQQTRAITIGAPVEQVWPWLAQLGQDRGGFYSYERLENLVGCRMPSADRVRLEHQHWQLGDKLWMYPPERLGGMGHAVLAAYVPGRALGFATRTPGRALSEPPDGSWSFVLEPLDARTTRLLVRGRDDVQVALWTAAFALFIVSARLVLRRRRWGRPLLATLGAAAAFQALTLVQPTPAIGAGLLGGVALLLREPVRAGPEGADRAKAVPPRRSGEPNASAGAPPGQACST